VPLRPNCARKLVGVLKVNVPERVKHPKLVELDAMAHPACIPQWNNGLFQPQGVTDFEHHIEVQCADVGEYDFAEADCLADLTKNQLTGHTKILPCLPHGLAMLILEQPNGPLDGLGYFYRV